MWRLPNIRELKSITDKTKSSLAINGEFNNTVNEVYWSSTRYADGSKKYAWSVSFENGNDQGYDNDNNLDKKHLVRCVQDIKPKPKM